MTSLLIILLIVISILVVPAVFTNILKWKYYHKYYKELPKHEYTKGPFKSLWLKYKQYESLDKKIIFFVDKGSLRVYNISFHNIAPTYLDPYTCYWYYKYYNWFKDNTDVFEEGGEFINI